MGNYRKIPVLQSWNSRLGVGEPGFTRGLPNWRAGQATGLGAWHSQGMSAKEKAPPPRLLLQQANRNLLTKIYFRFSFQKTPYVQI